MKYFYVNLACHVFVFCVLVVSMLIFLKRNSERKTKHGFVYLLPLVISLFAVLDMVFLAGPRLVDIQNMTTDSYQFTTGKVESVGFFNNTIVVDGKTFYINPLSDIPPEGSQIRIKHTDYAHYVVELSEASQAAIEDSKDEN